MAITKPPVLPSWAEAGDKVQPSNAEIQAGWPLSSIPPSRQRFNWLLNFLANGIRYFSRRGLPDYDATETYMAGDRIIGDDGKTYRSLIDNNTAQKPSTSPTKWERWGFTFDEFLAGVATPPQFDNDTSLATTAFVQRALGNFAASDSFAQDETLSAAKTGRNLLPNSNAITRVYLPSASAAGFTLASRGEAYHIQNTASQTIAVAPQGSDSIFVSGSSSGAGVALSLPVGAEVTLVRISNTAWSAFGTGALKSSADFGVSLAASGYQKLPSGLIIQWGNFAASASADTAVTFPISFPTACQAVTATHGLYAGVDMGSSVIVSKSTTGFSYASYQSGGARNGATNVFYFAIGY